MIDDLTLPDGIFEKDWFYITSSSHEAPYYFLQRGRVKRIFIASKFGWGFKKGSLVCVMEDESLFKLEELFEGSQEAFKVFKQKVKEYRGMKKERP